jgi:rhodanese-related sulfurtransferase
MDQIIEFAGNHALLSGGFVVALGLLVWTEVMRKIHGIPELTPAQAVAWINDPKTVVIDVSPVADFNKAHIINARNITMSRINDPDVEVNKLKDQKLLLVCKTAQISRQAGHKLKKLGAKDLAVIKGGMLQWQSDNFPVTRK